jgi:hypothetical protein
VVNAEQVESSGRFARDQVNRHDHVWIVVASIPTMSSLKAASRAGQVE